MDIKEQLKDIKTQLRLSMNGAVSQSMREKGLLDRKSTRLNSSHIEESRMPSSA